MARMGVWPCTRGALAVASLAVATLAGCWGIPGAKKDSCSLDQDCTAGQVCREAHCRKACPGGTWAGQTVVVESAAEPREAVIVSCDKGLWVKYASGIEEQVSPTRIRTERKSQAH